ncbi:MAG: hypothetical protein R8G60_11030 [Roseovarius pacificus]|nr:hypothetical protein [Roseovarius pacificus]
MDNHATNPRDSRRIGILPVEGFAMMSYAALTEPMRAANLLAGRDLYEMVNIGRSLSCRWPVPARGWWRRRRN